MSKEARANLAALAANPYPGRGIVVGLTEDEKHFAQVYWIMGRSANSRNRIFVQEGDTVRTAPHDASLVEDPSLIIYNCARVSDSVHIVTNGDQTDTIYDALASGGSFETALDTRSFEPDAPNFTPRISAVVNLKDADCAYKLGILKTIGNQEAYHSRQYFSYANAIPGTGHYVATYQGDGDPLPSFCGEPLQMPIGNDIDQVLEHYWSVLNEDNRVSLLVKFISAGSGATDTRIRNKLEG